MTSSQRTQPAYLALGAILFLILWQAVGYFHLVGPVWPPLTDVTAYLLDPRHQGLFLRALLATVSSAGLGYAIGAGVGTALALVANLYPVLRKGADRANAWVHAVPMIAIGPIFILLLGVDAAPVALSVLGVAFVFYVAATSGFSLSSHSHADVMTAFGANRYRRFVHLTLPAAMPAIATGMKLGVPRACIGAVIGEWFGAQRGLGVLMVTGMQEFQIPLLWSATVLITGISLLFFGLGSLIERLAEERFR